MAIVLSTPPYAQFFDSNGNPLAGGKVFTYLAGTLTPRPTYTTQAGTIANSNPVILDSAGRASIWLDDSAAYKFTVTTSADVPVRTEDNIQPFNTASGLSVLGTIAANTIVGNNTGSPATPTALTVAQVQSLLGGSSGVGAVNSGLSIVTSGATSVITANSILLLDTSNNSFTARSVNATINTATAAGLLAIDTGSWAINTWYYVYVISNGTLVSAIASLSSTAPTMPSGYTFRARVGAIRTSGTATTLLATRQLGRQGQYVVTGSSPNTNIPIMASGSAGAPATPTWVSVATGNFVPATASVIRGFIANAGSSVMAAPNNSYGAIGSASNPPPVAMSSGTGNLTFNFTLESTNIFWASNAASGLIACMGWEDNL